MDVGGAYGGGKAGAAFDPITFVQRPQVILRGVCLFSSLIVYSCISGKGYIEKDGKDVCLYNGDASACSYGKIVGFLGLVGSIGFLVGEYLFEQMSSVKTRKHYVLGDLGFSSFWAFLYFIAFCWLSSAWNKTEEPENHYGTTSAQFAILLSFCSIVTWAGCSWFAYQRFKQGVDPAFASTFEADPSGGQGYSSYPDGTDAAYQDPPFAQQQQQYQQQRPMGDFQAPTY
ncbi:synaptogyrin [Copidosoma floridanum]|uniref:synaptogyrin n=1 Tax=Copidosoma floridanum TaxID=29053 RepID=UPI0006C9D75F|nr:synaptogyrin [Copidosoma floridanum]